MNRNNQAEQMKAPGFWYTFLHTIKASFLSRDTILIFAGAIAFYLIFYAWPYGNQQIQHVPSAVLDLDRSAAARRLVTAMDASPAISVVRITQDEGEAMEAFRREEFSVLITIPKDFEKSLTRGENVTVHVLGNGAFPVKARAVQAALGGVVTDKTKLLDDAAVYATGLPGTSVHSHHQAAPGLRVQYMYNEIGGYGNYTVPVVGPVIIQAVMLMAITMALGGLWHGAAWRFVLWGGWHGASLAVHKWFMAHVPGFKAQGADMPRWRRIIGIVVTFHVVCFGWIMFRATDLQTARNMLSQIFTDFKPELIPQVVSGYAAVMGLMAVGYLLHLMPVRSELWAQRTVTESPLPVKVVTIAVLVWAVMLIKSAEIQPFIYFQF